ncbi:recombinase family protein [Mesotoga sp. Brook.08.YT.4.2.5.4.]
MLLNQNSIICHCLEHSRFARSHLDARKYKELLAEYGIKVISVSEPSIEGPENILLESNQEMLAEYFAAKLARDSMRGMITKAKKGQYLGGIVPFGYRKVKVSEKDWSFEKEEKEAQVVREIFEMRVEGVLTMQIARYVNQSGWKTRRGKAFTNASIDWVISNQKHKGVYSFNDRKKKGRFNYYKGEVVRADLPKLAIVPPDLWQRVQKMPGIQKESRLLYLLKGKLICGDCGFALSGGSYGGAKNKGGSYYCWNCRKRHNKYHKIGRDKIANVIVHYLREQVSNVDVRAVTDMANEKIECQSQKGRVEEIANEIQTIETAIQNITRAVESGTYSQSLLNRLSELERDKEKLLEERTKVRLQQVRFSKVTVDEMKDFLDTFLGDDSFAAHKDLVDFTLSSAKIIWKDPRIVEMASIFGTQKIPLL